MDIGYLITNNEPPHLRQIDMSDTDVTVIPPGHTLICDSHLSALREMTGLTDEQFIAAWGLVDDREQPE